jgi:hypothetical protein
MIEKEILEIKDKIESAICHTLDNNGLCDLDGSCKECISNLFKLLSKELNK